MLNNISEMFLVSLCLSMRNIDNLKWDRRPSTHILPYISYIKRNNIGSLQFCVTTIIHKKVMNVFSPCIKVPVIKTNLFVKFLCI